MPAASSISAASNLSVGSIEGAGRFQLGNTTLTSGSLNTDTTVSGLIVNGGISGGSPGSLAKVGAGTLTLTGANTYSGVTTVSGGILSTNLLPDGGVAGGIGNSSNIAANLVLNGGMLQYTGPTTSTNRLFTLRLRRRDQCLRRRSCDFQQRRPGGSVRNRPAANIDARRQ